MSPLNSLIRWEIKEKGSMTVTRFMEIALYHPELGYYAKRSVEANIGRNGDFFTSVSVGPLFGKLLAHKINQWWEELGQPRLFAILEFGAFDGQLAYDILDILRNDFPHCAENLEYNLFEPLPRLENLQKKMLEEFPQVRWIEDVQHLSAFTGIVIGNELLDAFPVHQLEAVNGEWMECYLDLLGEQFQWVHRPCPSALKEGLPLRAKGRVEVSPQAQEWIHRASSVIEKGKILLLDYGWTDEEYFQVERIHGTLRAYRDHRYAENILEKPGEQDITAHVRWTPLIQEAEKLGFKVEEFIQQNRWLTRIVAEKKLDLNPQEVRQFHTLSHPEIMGNAFRVLVLNR